MTRWNEDLRPGESGARGPLDGYAAPDRYSVGPLGFVATRNTPLELALGDIGFVEADYPAPRGSVGWVGRAESAYGFERTKLGEDQVCWGHFGVPATALEAGRVECARVGVDASDEAAVLALAAARAGERHAARQAARAGELARMELARRLQVQAEEADDAARRLALVQSQLVEEADGCPVAHEWLRGRFSGESRVQPPRCTEEEIGAALAAFGGGVIPSDDDGRPVCRDAYERALWGFIVRLASMLPDGFPCLPGQVMGAGVPTDPLYSTPARALDRAKLGKWKGAWLWCCHYREVVGQYSGMSRRGRAELAAEGYRPIPDALWARAERVAALR